MKRISPIIVIPYVAVLLTGCIGLIGPETPLLDRLNNRGPVMLSSDNPYLPANRLLQGEIDNHSEVQELVSERGFPKAIEVKKSLLASTQLSLIYPDQNESYPLTYNRGAWTIGSPEVLTENTLALLSKGATNDGLTLNKQSVVGDNHVSARASLKSQPTSSRFARVVISKTKGLTHTVTFKGENLSLVSAWYTGSAANTGKIAKINKLRSKDLLHLGDTILIPPTLLHNKQPMPASAVK